MSPLSPVTTLGSTETTSTFSRNQSENLTILNFLTQFNEQRVVEPSQELLSKAQKLAVIRRELGLSLMQKQEEEKQKRQKDLEEIARINAKAQSRSSCGPSIVILGPGPISKR